MFYNTLLSYSLVLVRTITAPDIPVRRNIKVYIRLSILSISPLKSKLDKIFYALYKTSSSSIQVLRGWGCPVVMDTGRYVGSTVAVLSQNDSSSRRDTRCNSTQSVEHNGSQRDTIKPIYIDLSYTKPQASKEREVRVISLP